MRVLAFLVAVVVLFSAWQLHRRAENQDRLALVASELAQRDVEVGCPGFWARLVEITPYAGWVDYDEHGNPERKTSLSAATCRHLERLWRADEPPRFECLLARACDAETYGMVGGIVTLAHESWHLRGVKDEAQTQCYAVQTVELTARLFRVGARDARILAWHVAAQDAAATPGTYHSPECRPGGLYDLAPHTAAWPG